MYSTRLNSLSDYLGYTAFRMSLIPSLTDKLVLLALAIPIYIVAAHQLFLRESVQREYAGSWN